MDQDRLGSRLPLRGLTVTLAPFGVVLVGLALFELIAASSEARRDAVLPIFVGLAAATTAATLVLPRMTARFQSLRRGILLASLSAMLATAVAITISAAAMVVSPAAVPVLLLLAAIGGALGIVLEYAVARSLTADLARLREAARRIADGDMSARLELERLDEVGQAARTLNGMAAQLRAMEEHRSQARAAREAFLTAVGHDLRTPLAALSAAVEALEDGLAPDPQRYYAAIHHNLDAMRTLVDDLFLLARIQAGSLALTRVPVDLAEIVDEAVEALTPIARQHAITIRFQPEAQVITQGAAGELGRAVRNLLDNAIRHTGAETEVLVEVLYQGGDCVVRVRDQGPGFPDEVRRRLLEDFSSFTATDARTHVRTGLGLAIARGIVEAHGGAIWMETGPPGRVGFRMPAAT